MRHLLSAQGATEYLVLLAVVLVIALVGIALLGFFPGTASDAQEQESRIYWQSASPIEITEWAARAYTPDPRMSVAYLRIRNAGTYPIRITQMLGGGRNLTMIWRNNNTMMSEVYYLAPGEETYFGAKNYGFPALGEDRLIDFYPPGIGCPYCFQGTSSLCSANQSSNGFGQFVIKDFGFDYVQYVEGQQLTKRQVGKALTIDCSGPT